jgi:hypothetical protein
LSVQNFLACGPTNGTVIKYEVEMFLDKLSALLVLAEHFVETECDVRTLYGYSCIWTPPFSCLLNVNYVISLENVVVGDVQCCNITLNLTVLSVTIVLLLKFDQGIFSLCHKEFIWFNEYM